MKTPRGFHCYLSHLPMAYSSVPQLVKAHLTGKAPRLPQGLCTQTTGMAGPVYQLPTRARLIFGCISERVCSLEGKHKAGGWLAL